MKNEDIKVGFVGYYGGINFGDEALVKSFNQLLNENNIPNDNITVFSANSKYIESTFNLKSVLNTMHNVGEIIREIDGLDIVFVGGGGIFHDMKYRYSMFFYVFPILIAVILGKKVGFFGVAVDPPITSRFNRYVIKYLSKVSDFFVVRDVVSHNYLKKILNLSNIVFVDDPVFALKYDDPQTGNDDNGDGEFRKLIKVGINIRTWQEKEFFLIDTPAAFINENADNHRYYFFTSKSDEEITALLLSKLNRDVQYETIDATDPASAFEKMSSLDLMISERLHFIIGSIILNNKVIGISYLPKVESTCLRWEVPYLSLEKLSLEDLKIAINDEIQSNRALMRSEKLKNRAQDIKKTFSDLFKKEGARKSILDRFRAFAIITGYTSLNALNRIPVFKKFFSKTIHIPSSYGNKEFNETPVD